MHLQRKITLLFVINTFALGIALGWIISYNFHTKSNQIIHHRTIREASTNQDLSYKSVNQVVLQKLYDDVKILCLIPIKATDTEKTVRHVQNTWGKRCNKLIFTSTKPIEGLSNVAVVDTVESWEHLWGKVKESLKYIHHNYVHEFDWVLKADSDTYVIMENLRFMLHKYSTKFPVFFGNMLKTNCK